MIFTFKETVRWRRWRRCDKGLQALELVGLWGRQRDTHIVSLFFHLKWMSYLKFTVMDIRVLKEEEEPGSHSLLLLLLKEDEVVPSSDC